MKKMTLLLVSIALLGIGTAVQPLHAQEHQGSMQLHHMHLVINHAVQMAAEGSNLVMLGEMNMAPGVDEQAVEHGKGMIREGKALVKSVLQSKTMTELHQKGAGESSEMTYTHKLAEAATAYIDQLAEMHAVK
ncbi:hypothetical protein [Verrucomicrobium sp. 3C]|uniref:hypothetical protein n=1 Tax=Verrucomicrobium sp. 3C TaxID=1134055 RepID=UPI000373421D|nr:hypothetical protein [Verrucomicrobium sp. 3C]